jgi:DNA-binding ferritin-like protein
MRMTLRTRIMGIPLVLVALSISLLIAGFFWLITGIWQNQLHELAVSQETSKIIKVIDEIAFQTNLLVLNAAVTQQNSAHADETALASNELKSLSSRLNRVVEDLASLLRGGKKRGNFA